MNRLSPVRTAKWLGVAYAAALALFVLWSTDADSLVLSILFLPWIIGPAALAATASKASSTEAGAWAFLWLEAAVIASTAWFWIYLIVIEPEAQNGIAILISVPLLQYGAVGLFETARSSRRRRHRWPAGV